MAAVGFGKHFFANFTARKNILKIATTDRNIISSAKGGAIFTLLDIIYLNYWNYIHHTSNVLKQYLIDVKIVNYCTKNFYLIAPMNEKIAQILCTKVGAIQHAKTQGER